MLESAKTSATLQTPPGRGGIAVIVLAGSGAERILSEVFRPYSTHRFGGEGALQLGHLIDANGVIDEAIVTRRGEAFEINIHGGSAVAKSVLEHLARCGAAVGSAAAAPESFPVAHRRWNNPAIGREMLQTLPQARSMLGVASLSRQWSAGLSELARGDPSAEKLRQAACALAKMLRLLNPAEVVVAGAPNVGKSTLANALIGRQVSIVCDDAGTTRDWVRELATLNGVAVYLTDTAGIWQATDQIDAEAIRRARQCIEAADLVVLLHVGQAEVVPDWLRAAKLLRVAAKCDARPPKGRFDVCVSALTGEGLNQLKTEIVNRIGLSQFDPSMPMAFTQRQADLLLAAAEALERSDAGRAQNALRQLLEG